MNDELNGESDVTAIVDRFEIIDNALDALRGLQSLEYGEFEEEYYLRSAAEREFQVAIQAALDVGDIIIARETGTEAETYEEIFPTLAEIGVLPQQFADHFKKMATFRNVLVYMYVDVDLEQMYRYLQEDLVDFELFMQYVGAYLTERHGGEE